MQVKAVKINLTIMKCDVTISFNLCDLSTNDHETLHFY